jgi:hypothetical protein
MSIKLEDLIVGKLYTVFRTFAGVYDAKYTGTAINSTGHMKYVFKKGEDDLDPLYLCGNQVPLCVMDVV